MIIDEKESNWFNLNQKKSMNPKEKKTKLSLIALMKYRIEKMNRKLSENRNQSKLTTKAKENRE